VQAHAFDHYLHGGCGGRFPIDDARPDMRCPMCLRWLPRSEFSLEHAPQWANQSRLGPPWLVVSTCSPCNSGVAGATFESAAAIVKKADEATGEDPMCRVHGTSHGERVFNAGWMTSHEPVTLADLKSAYLIAFAVLGYSWATSSRLAPLRGAIASGRPAQPADALETCGLVTDASAGRTVMEVSAPLPMVLVVSPEAELVIALPLAGTHDVTAACGAVAGQSVTSLGYPWPLMVRETERSLGATGFTKPEDAWDTGLTFHLDRCDEPHAAAVNPSRSNTRAANRRFRAEAP
jgi:hypothetical protein